MAKEILSINALKENNTYLLQQNQQLIEEREHNNIKLMDVKKKKREWEESTLSLRE